MFIVVIVYVDWDIKNEELYVVVVFVVYFIVFFGIVVMLIGRDLVLCYDWFVR